MNKDNARDYLPLVQALAEGKTIQVKNSDGSWTDLINFVMMEDASKYRIKPEPKKAWYRVAMFKFGSAHISTSTDQSQTEKGLSEHPHFVRWLTDRIEYTLPEGDA